MTVASLFAVALLTSSVGVAADNSLSVSGTDLRPLTRGAAAAAFDPAGATFADGFELHYRHLISQDVEGAGRFGGFAVLPIGPVTLIGGYDRRDIPGYRHGRTTLGLGVRLADLAALALSYRAIDFDRDSFTDGGVWDVGLLVQPASFLSLSVGVDAFNGPILGTRRQRAQFDFGLGLRPILGADWLTLGLESRLHHGDDDRYHFATRALVDVAPLTGLHLLAAYHHDTVPTVRHGVWVGLSLALGSLELSAAGVVAQSGGAPAFGELAIAGTLRSRGKENLVPMRGRVVELALRGDLRGEASLLGGDPAMATVALDLERLAVDPTVDTVVLYIGGLEVGMGSVDELRGAVRRLRAAGKTVIAELSNAEEKEWLIAAAADRIRMDPMSTLRLDGFVVTARYFAAGLEKLGIRFESVEIGRYKSGPDPLTRSDARPEDREIIPQILDAAQRTLRAALLEDRHLEATQVDAILAKGALTAADAMALGVVDELSGPAGANDAEPSRVTGGALPEAPPSRRWGGAPVIRVIPIIGTIAVSAEDNPLPGETATAGGVIGELEAAANDANVAAVVLRIDSPGGDVTAADLIWRAVRRLRERKPVVVSMGDVAASGGYYVAAPADVIIAEPNSITGSIGIFSVSVNLSGLYDWLGVRNEVFKTGVSADWDETNRGLSDDERKRFVEVLTHYYDGFVARVAAGRRLSVERVGELAQGKVYTGSQALELGLVDALGGLADAVNEARRRAGLDTGDEARIEVSTLDFSLGRMVRAAVSAQQNPVEVAWGELHRRARAFSQKPLVLLPMRIVVDGW